VSKLKNIPVEQLQPNPWNREHFSPQSLRELVSSIRHLGIMEPLIVRPVPRAEGQGPSNNSELGPQGSALFQIASGHRRWLAAREAGLKEVPCLVKDLSAEEVQDMNLATNLQREDLPVLERARMIRARMEAGGLTQAQMAARLGKERSWVAKITGVLNLHPDALSAIKGKEVALRPLLALRTLPKDKQIRIAEEVKNGETLPDAIERRVQELSGKKLRIAVKDSAEIPSPTPTALTPKPAQETPTMVQPKDIKIYAVRRALLKGQWFEVETGSFQVHPYRYAVKEGVVYAGGDGFSFMQKGGTRLSGPLSSIEAVMCDEE